MNDPYREAAAKVYGVAADDVTDEQENAVTLAAYADANGAPALVLAQHLGITVEAAWLLMGRVANHLPSTETAVLPQLTA